MILVDFSQAMITRIVHNKAKLDENTIRHMCLDRVLSIKKQFGSRYGDMIMCRDSYNYWRKQIFPFYKGRRRDNMEKSPLDWSLIMNTINKFGDELAENFPYKVILVDRAEADDIIGVVTKEFSKDENVLIYSGDGDFGQLQKYPNVTQYSPVTKKTIGVKDPERFLKQKIIKGDAGDGIPNILSDDNVFMLAEARQTPIRTSKLNKWLNEDPSVFCENDLMRRNWHRNLSLIDLDHIPEEIKSEIVRQYKSETKDPGRTKLFNYMVDYGLVGFLQNLQDF